MGSALLKVPRIKSFFVAVIVLLLLFAAGARLYDLRADPPSYFADGSQDVTTDGAYLTYHARNVVLFGQADLFGYQIWPAFKYSLVSGVAYAVFSIAGASRITSGCVGLLLSIGSLCIFLFVLARRSTLRVAAIAGLFLCANFLMWVYGRLPFSENGLLFIASLVFLVYSFWFDRLWGKVLVGVLVAAAGMCGKSFGFLLILGPLAAIFFEDRKNLWSNLLALLAPAIAFVAVIQLALFGDQNFFSFLWEHGAGEHGAPHGFSSIPAYFESLITFGRKGLHGYAPVESVLAGLMVLTLILRTKSKSAPDRIEIFMVSWLVGTIVFMSPFNYQPLRYHFPLIVPMAVLAALWLTKIDEVEFGRIGKLLLLKLIPLVLVLWYVIHYCIVHPLNSEMKLPMYYRTAWYATAGALIVAAVLLVKLKRRTVRIPKKVGRIILIGALGIAILVNGASYYTWIYSRSYNIEEAATDLQALVVSDAVIGGQYGPALASGGGLRSFPYFVTTELNATAQTYRKYEVTHIAVNSSLWKDYCEAAPVLKQAPIVARYWLRDSPIFIVRIASVFGNRTAASSPMTDYERAVSYRLAQQPDSARHFLDRFLTQHPNSKQGLMLSYQVAFSADPMGRARVDIDTLAAHYPTDFVAQFMGASYYHWLGSNSRSKEFEIRAQDYLRKAIALTPINEVNLTKMYEINPPDAPVIR